MSRSVGRVPGSEAALKGAAGPEARVHVVQTDIVEGEGQAVESDGVVQAVEVEQAEEDKGIEEGQAGGFVVFAPDGKVRGERVCAFVVLSIVAFEKLEAHLNLGTSDKRLRAWCRMDSEGSSCLRCRDVCGDSTEVQILPERYRFPSPLFQVDFSTPRPPDTNPVLLSMG